MDKQNEKALARVAHIAGVKGIQLDGTEALGLAEFYLESIVSERAIVRAADICNKKGVKVSGGELLRLARFIL
jgi:hypothetical protein